MARRRKEDIGLSDRQLVIVFVLKVIETRFIFRNFGRRDGAGKDDSSNCFGGSFDLRTMSRTFPDRRSSFHHSQLVRGGTDEWLDFSLNLLLAFPVVESFLPPFLRLFFSRRYAEFKRFTPLIPAMIYHGSKPTREEKRPYISKKSQCGPYRVQPVVITSYEVIIMDRKVRFRWHRQSSGQLKCNRIWLFCNTTV